MTNAWVQKRKKDQYYRLAKIKGYRSRAAYKLLQAIRSYALIRAGDTVVDLGSHPGGWLQVVREVVGPEGLAIGLDIKDVAPLPFSNVRILKMDIHTIGLVDRILVETKGPADAVISDLAPSITGSWDVDHARQVDLARIAFEVAKDVLKHGGNVLIKLFQGPELKGFQEEAAPLFKQSRLLKPPASRPESSEVYFLGLGFKPRWVRTVPGN
jgi:23S rRNA (uridine2552-2'-O)-methyltransferase